MILYCHKKFSVNDMHIKASPNNLREYSENRVDYNKKGYSSIPHIEI